MSIEDEVKDLVYNISKAEHKIYSCPQTYNTLLKCCKDNGTLQMIIRRKLNISWKEGRVSKIIIPGTRRGLVVFTSPEKEYHLLVEDSRVGVNIYYFFNFEQPNNFAIQLNNYWKLQGDEWIKHSDGKIISKGSVLKWI